MNQLITDYEDAVNYIYGDGSTHWKIIPDVESNKRFNSVGYWKYIYCDDEGNPKLHDKYKGGNWFATLSTLNIMMYKPLPNTDGLSPVIYKIRKLEARFNRRASV